MTLHAEGQGNKAQAGRLRPSSIRPCHNYIHDSSRYYGLVIFVLSNVLRYNGFAPVCMRSSRVKQYQGVMAVNTYTLSHTQVLILNRKCV